MGRVGIGPTTRGLGGLRLLRGVDHRQLPGSSFRPIWPALDATDITTLNAVLEADHIRKARSERLRSAQAAIGPIVVAPERYSPLIALVGPVVGYERRLIRPGFGGDSRALKEDESYEYGYGIVVDSAAVLA